MANNLTEVRHKILAQGLLALRENCVMPALVNTDYSNDAKQLGNSVDIPVPSAVPASDVTPSYAYPSTDPDVVPTSVSVVLNQWKEAPFALTDSDLAQADNGIIPMQASEAIKSLANAVNAHIFSFYWGVYGQAGDVSDTPFNATDGTADATATRKLLNKQLAPLNDRRFVIDPDAEANALNLRAFQDFSFAGDTEGIREGRINKKLGFNWFMDQAVPTHTAGTLTGTITASATNAGLKTVELNSGAGEAIALKKGDIVTFAGHSQTYAVQADLTVGASDTGNVSINPGLAVALAGTEEISVVGNHVVNLGFHRDAFAFASRPLLDVDVDGLGSLITAATDPVSGLSLRLEISRQYKRVRWSFDILYGAQLVRPELAARCAGKVV